jgi:hypothetical protein
MAGLSWLLFMVSWSLAGFCGAAIGNFFVSNNSSPLIHFASVGLLVSILITGFYRYTLPATQYICAKPKLFIKPDKNVLLLGLIAFCCMICEGSMADWTGVYFRTSYMHLQNLSRLAMFHLWQLWPPADSWVIG